MGNSKTDVNTEACEHAPQVEVVAPHLLVTQHALLADGGVAGGRAGHRPELVRRGREVLRRGGGAG